MLLDILLEAESGWTLLTEMKGQAATRDIPILVLTVVDGKERALALGAADFCLKPIDQDWLLDRLDALEQGGPLNTVLIIDDEEADRYVLKGLLTAQGRFAIVEAANGEEGLRRAREERPDVIFLDLIMPDMTGFEVLERLKSDDATKGIPGDHQYLGDPERGGAPAAHRRDGGDPLQVRRAGGGGVRDDPGGPDPGGLETDPCGHGVVTWPAGRPTPC